MEDFDEIIDSGTGIVKEETYSGHEITIKRLQTEDCELVSGVSSGFHYEFEAYIDGEPITTAGEIETRGYENPWIPALTQYLKAYIDGMHDGAERGNPYTEKYPAESFQGD